MGLSSNVRVLRCSKGFFESPTINSSLKKPRIVHGRYTWTSPKVALPSPADIEYRRVWPAMEAALHLCESIGDDATIRAGCG